MSLLLASILFLSIRPVDAQPVAPSEGLRSNDPRLEKWVEKQTRSSAKVDSVDQGLILVDKRYQMPVKSPVILHRVDGDNLEILAMGRIVREQDSFYLIELDLSTVVKAPRAGDLVSLMSNPPNLAAEDESMKGKIGLSTPPLPPESGYLELVQGATSGDLTVTSSDRTNSFKGPSSYKLTDLRFTWFFEFIWQLGISYQSWNGSFPTSTYYRNSGESLWSGSELAISYRIRPFYKYFRPTFSLINFNETFTSFNPDEALVSSTYKGTALGVKLAGEFNPVDWAPSVKYFDITISEVFVDFQYAMAEVVDVGKIKRGQSAKSAALNYRAGLTSLIYIPWIPFLKRYVITAEYGTKNYAMEFSGPTLSEVGGIYTVPENGSYTEGYTFYRWMVGVRLDDFIGEFFMPR